MMKRIATVHVRALVIATVAMLLFAAAFPYGARTATPRQGGTLTIVQPADPTHFNEQGDPFSGGIEVISNVQDGLLTFDPATQAIVPGLAKSYSISPDGLTYSFVLRDGVKFSDGTPLSADDVVFTFSYLTGERPGSLYVGQFKPFIDSVTAPEPNRVVIKMKRPFNDFATLLAGAWEARIMSKSAVETAGKDYGQTTTIGTGPFVLKEWVKGDHVTMVRNPAYWGRRPYLDQVIYRTVPDDTARLIQAKSGQADVVYQPPLDQLDQAVHDPGLRVLAAQGTAIFFLRLDTASKPFSDLKTRQIVFYGTDRDAIRKSTFGDYATTATDLFPSWHWAYAPMTGWHDPAKAKALLQEAGYTAQHPLAFDLAMFNQPVFTEIGTLVQAQMKVIGVQVNLRPLDPATLDQLTIKKAYQAMVTREGYPMGLSDDYIWKQYSGSGNDNRTYLNMPGGVQAPEIERLIDAARGAKDRTAAKGLYRQVATMVVANAVEVTIGFPKNVDVVSTRVQNWHVGGTVLELLRDVSVQ